MPPPGFAVGGNLPVAAKKVGSECASKKYRRITVTLSNGRRVEINSPYFIKAKSHGRRRKREPNGTSAHSGLEILCGMTKIFPVWRPEVGSVLVVVIK